MSEGTVLFVHGLGGSALKTWRHFDKLLSQDQIADDYEIIFYGYGYRYRQLGTIIDIFRTDLEAIIFSDASSPESCGRKYERQGKPEDRQQTLIIVAHSMGAVLVRKALLDIFGDQNNDFPEPLFTDIRIVFYAPAHSGINPEYVYLAERIFSKFPLSRALSAGFLFPCINDLKADSVFIGELAEKQRRMQQPHVNGHSFNVFKVLHAEWDKLVVNRSFPGDPASEILRGFNHMTLCKPGLSDDARYAALRTVFEI